MFTYLENLEPVAGEWRLVKWVGVEFYLYKDWEEG